MQKILYRIILKISNWSGDVRSAACNCPAGLGLGGFGNCNHVGVILFALEDFNRRGLRKYATAISCTSNTSSIKTFSPAWIDKIIIQTINFGKDNERSNLPRYQFYDPRSSTD